MTTRRPRPDQTPGAGNRTIFLGIGLALLAPILAGLILTAMMFIRYTARPAAAPSATAAPAVLGEAATPFPTPSASVPSMEFTPAATPAALPDQATEVAGQIPSPSPEPSSPATATGTPAVTRLTATATLAAISAAPATQTSAPVAATATATVSSAPSATNAAAVSATPSLTPAPVAFAGTRAFFDATLDSFRVVGEIVNHTNGAQQLVKIAGTFFDAQGGVLAGPDETLEFFPQAVIPPGDRVPFELLVDKVTTIARYELMVDYVPSLLPVRQDLTIDNLAQSNQSGRYCLAGVLRNPGARLTDQLVIAAVLYDAGGQVVNFGEHIVEAPAAPYGAQPLNFEVCVPPPNAEVTQTQVRAWGR